jgi:hypothetical protein
MIIRDGRIEFEPHEIEQLIDHIELLKDDKDLRHEFIEKVRTLDKFLVQMRAAVRAAREETA